MQSQEVEHADVAAVVVPETLVVDLWVHFSIKQQFHWRCLHYNKPIKDNDNTKENHIAEGLYVEEDDRMFHNFNTFQ
jgi:hypothetical protein